MNLNRIWIDFNSRIDLETDDIAGHRIKNLCFYCLIQPILYSNMCILVIQEYHTQSVFYMSLISLRDSYDCVTPDFCTSANGGREFVLGCTLFCEVDKNGDGIVSREDLAEEFYIWSGGGGFNFTVHFL